MARDSHQNKLISFPTKQALYGTNVLVTAAVQAVFVVICASCGVVCASCLVLCPQRCSAEAGRVLPGWLELLPLSHPQLFINASLNTRVLSPLIARLFFAHPRGMSLHCSCEYVSLLYILELL